MKAIFYLQAFCHLLCTATATTPNGNCMPNDEYDEPWFVKNLCKNYDNVKDFLIAADVMVRSDCFLVNSCRRIVERPHNEIEEVDFVVVGGGAAGPVVASRLSENPNWTVTLLEAGPEQPAATDIPGMMMSAIGSKYDWIYETVPQKNACLSYGGKCGWPRGKQLGGTVALSGSMYSRGHRDIYDSWSAKGNKGWGYNDVLPFFKMSENNKDYKDSYIHGTDGPIPVQKPTEVLPITKTLMAAARELGYEEIDMSAPDAMGFSVAQAMISSGKTRVTTATAYLRPHLRTRSNLRVNINCLATRLLINGTTVYGVEYVDRENVTRRLLARKEVILSAGTIGSAHLLMVSGIGPAEDLRPLNVTVVRDLRVGHNLQHHVATKLEFWLNKTHDRPMSFETIMEYLRTRRGTLSTTGALQTSALVRSDLAAPNGPSDVQLFFDGFSPSCANVQTSYGGLCNKNRKPMAKVTARPANLRPRSRGVIRLISADPLVRPLIDPGYLTADEDVEVLVWSLKLIVRLVATGPLKALGATVDANPAKPCRQHVFGTDPYWRCLVRYSTSGENHHAGTCKMGPASDPQAVVDPQLRVHGVAGIRVADASIMPLQPNANPIAATIMIGEKAARFIKDTWTTA